MIINKQDLKMKFKFIVLTVALTIITFNTSNVKSDTLQNKTEWFIDESHKEINCLAKNIYFESRSDMRAGQIAVADVVLNRVKDTRWPNTICGVIYDGPISEWHYENTGKKIPIKNKCQFSWYCDGKSDEPKDINSWRNAQIIAYQIVINKNFRGITEGSTHYHAEYVSPSWKNSLQYVGQIGSHLFYREN